MWLVTAWHLLTASPFASSNAATQPTHCHPHAVLTELAPGLIHYLHGLLSPLAPWCQLSLSVHTCHHSYPTTLSLGRSAKPVAARAESRRDSSIGEQTPAASAVPWHPTRVIHRPPPIHSRPSKVFPPTAPASLLCAWLSCLAAPWQLYGPTWPVHLIATASAAPWPRAATCSPRA